MMFLSCYEPLTGSCVFFYSAMMLIVVFDSCGLFTWAIVVHVSICCKKLKKKRKQKWSQPTTTICLSIKTLVLLTFFSHSFIDLFLYSVIDLLLILISERFSSADAGCCRSWRRRPRKRPSWVYYTKKENTSKPKGAYWPGMIAL